jgi:serine/threonine-protein kinase
MPAEPNPSTSPHEQKLSASSDAERWRVISAIADAALDLPAPDRAAFIGQQCASDAALHREVQRYVDACDKAAGASGFLTGHAGVRASGMIQDLGVRTSHAEAAVPELLASALSGRYTVQGEIGRGGMAMVFAALDEHDHGQVAIKVLRPALARELGTQRFLREIEIMARLRHPNLVPLLESGEAAGLLYYVMPRVQGEPLSKLLVRDRQLPSGRSLAIARDVASALDYAHSLGVVHRDVKPANILLDDGGARVVDFGVARAIVAASGERLTATGLVVGTSHYMSPEQAVSEKELDGRSDVYALACVVYEMLAGTPPFTGPTPQIVLAKHLRARAPDVRDLCPSLSARTAAVISKGLAKDPEHRFPSAGEFAQALDSSL